MTAPLPRRHPVKRGVVGPDARLSSNRSRPRQQMQNKSRSLNGLSAHIIMAIALDADEALCTIEELENIITAPACGLTALPSTPYDEIIPGLFIGEGDAAQSVVTMKGLGVTHIVNAALGKSPYHVNTNHVMYRKHNISFLGIEATDFMNFDLSPYFRSAADFIQEGLEKGKVMVHCVQGVSRSATLVIAYLMLKHYMRVQAATRLVRKRREICPNPGFLQQLCHLDQTLKKTGHFFNKPARSFTDCNLPQPVTS